MLSGKHELFSEKRKLSLGEKLEINLRHSCIECAFFSSCPVAERSGSPEIEPMIGSFGMASLKERCVL
jgi:hypothetical protein